METFIPRIRMYMPTDHAKCALSSTLKVTIKKKLVLIFNILFNSSVVQAKGKHAQYTLEKKEKTV